MKRPIFKFFLLFVFLVLSACGGGGESDFSGNSDTQPDDHLMLVTTGEIVYVPRGSEIEYDWFYYVPDSLSKTINSHILVTGLHGNYVTDDYSLMAQDTQMLMSGRIDPAISNGYVLLAPVIPRSASSTDTYTVSLDRESLESNGFNYRADLKLNKMLDKLISDLSGSGYNVSSKIYIEGFSAGAMFSQRYALLHPERVLGVAAGQAGGSITLPVAAYNGQAMPWPLGVADMENLVGYPLNEEEYNKVHQLVYIGNLDVNNSTVEFGNGDLFTDDQIQFLNDNFGTTDPVRLQNQSYYAESVGADIEFALYDGVMHTQTDAMYNDIFNFFESIVE